MARKLIAAIAPTALVLAIAPPAVAEDATQASQQRYAPGEALVRFEPGVVAAERREARGDARVELEDALSLPRVQLVSFDGPVHAAIARLEDQPGVAGAQPNFRYHALAPDTHFGQLWGLQPTPGVGALAAWSRTRGAGVVIAILDTGVDLTHPDIAPNLWTGPGGIHGHDFVQGDSSPDDFESHGTHVAGTAAAVADNGIGVAGVAPQAQIMAVRVLDGNGEGFSSDIANGIVFAADNGAGVVNMSLGGPGDASPDTAVGQAVTYAGNRGTVAVVAAGNESNNNDGPLPENERAPCNLPHDTLICVAALDNESELASYSNFGATSVDVGAPGGDTEGTEQEVLSAKPAWLTKFNENFEAIADWTGSGTGVAWGIEGPMGSRFASDSPGVQYMNNTDSQLAATAPVSMNGVGCRMRFDYNIDTAGPGDVMTVGVNTSSGLVALEFTGVDEDTSETAIPEVDGQSVTPTLRFRSDGSGVDAGGLVDEFRLACRGGAPADYDDEIVASHLFDLTASQGGGSYMAISGTSMAAPHVAGVAALVRSVDPGAPAAQIVQAIKETVTPLASLSGFTSTGGATNALPAIDRVIALPNPLPPPPPPAPPTRPARAAITRVSVNTRGVITLVVRGDAGTRGTATLRANIARTRAARVMTVARKTFGIGSRGRATVKLKLKRAAFRQLKRTRKLRMRSRIVLRNAAGLSSTARGTIRLRFRRR